MLNIPWDAHQLLLLQRFKFKIIKIFKKKNWAKQIKSFWKLGVFSRAFFWLVVCTYVCMYLYFGGYVCTEYRMCWRRERIGDAVWPWNRSRGCWTTPSPSLVRGSASHRPCFPQTNETEVLSILVSPWSVATSSAPTTLGWSRNEDSVEWPSQPQKLLLLLLLSMWEPSPQTTHSNFVPSWSSSILLRICCWIWSSALSVCLSVFSRIDKFGSHPIHKCLAPTHPLLKCLELGRFLFLLTIPCR